MERHLDILNQHVQLRQNSCFQMAPELALKISGIIHPIEYPFQFHPWDEKGFEPYKQSHTVGEYLIEFEEKRYEYPYSGMRERLQEEIDKGNFPVVSLRPEPHKSWHGYVAFEQDENNDFVILTKRGSSDLGKCESRCEKLDSKLSSKEKVDCLFWKATKIH